MEIICRACGQSHKTSGKLEASLAQLQPGQKLRIKCTRCKEPILLDSSMLNGDESLGIAVHRAVRKITVKPPEPPDTSWLDDGTFEEDEVVSDIPQALILMPPGPSRDEVAKALNGLGYRSETADEIGHALEKMQFFNYSSIVMHTAFSEGGLRQNGFHKHLCNMSMSRRRYIFYVLIGPELKTFYNMQALSFSANLVVAEKDTKHFGIILRKAIPEYEELFGPYMEELKVQGR